MASPTQEQGQEEQLISWLMPNSAGRNKTVYRNAVCSCERQSRCVVKFAGEENPTFAHDGSCYLTLTLLSFKKCRFRCGGRHFGCLYGTGVAGDRRATVAGGRGQIKSELLQIKRLGIYSNLLAKGLCIRFSKPHGMPL